MDKKASGSKTVVPADTAVAASKARPRKRQTLEERTPAARNEIFSAAAKVVGECGYADASVARITASAGIAQGTFYLYFASRQALLDELLPHVGQDMLEFIGMRIAGSADVFEMEERGFRAFFEYLRHNPGFFRILNEAEAAAPVAFQKHFKLLSKHYVTSLARGVKSGHIRTFGREELETLVYMFMAARGYLYLRYVKNHASGRKLPESVVQTYMKFVRNGLK